MPANDTGHHALVGEMVQPPLAAIPLTRGVDQRELSGRAGGHEALLERHRQRFREADPDEAAGGDGVTLDHDPRRVSGGDELVASHDH
jgi:hypothetical protein